MPASAGGWFGARILARLGVCAALFVVGTMEQDFAIERTGATLGGPLFGGILCIAPLVVAFLIAGNGPVAGSRWRAPAVGVAMLAGLLYLYGISVYWAGTDRGVTFHRGLVASRSLDRTDVGTWTLTCSSGRHGGKSARFTIRVRDDTSILVGGSDDGDGRAQFEQLGRWTRGHPVQAAIGDGSSCPNFVAGFPEAQDQ